MPKRIVDLIRPTIILVGRTNVGKSTLFNRLTRPGTAMVSSQAGTTRDLLTALLHWQGQTGTLVDTGGLAYPPDPKHFRRPQEAAALQDPYLAAIQKKITSILKQADHCCLVVDASTGMTSEDERWASWLRAQKIPVTVVVNKADNPRLREQAWEFYKMGFEDVAMVSATNGSGSGDLLDHLFKKNPSKKTATASTEEEKKKPPAIALLGKPNVGKSTLFNALLGSDEAIVSPIAHTTREPSRRSLMLSGITIDLYDTVGIRRNLNARQQLEQVGSLRTLRQIEHSQVAVLVLDPFTEKISHQDQELARRIQEARCAAIIVINKVDQQPSEERRAVVEKMVSKYFPHLWFAPVLFVSAAHDKGITVLTKTILRVYENHRRVFTELELRKALQELVLFPKDRKKQSAASHLEQIHTSPPEFLARRLKQQKTPIAIIDIMEKRLREQLPLEGTPITIHVERVLKIIPNSKKKPV